MTIDTASDWGVRDWLVDCDDQLWRQWFWYRVGDTGKERPINSLNFLGAHQSAYDTLSVTYGNGQFRIELTFTLSSGPGLTGSIHEQITIENLTSQNLNLHFFQYSDFDLGGYGPGDSLVLERDENDLFVRALQDKGGVIFSDTLISPGANHGEAGTLDSIYNRLANNSATTLNDNAGPIYGDTEWAFQWDVNIDACSTWSLEILKGLAPAVIPEPTSASLLLLGLSGFALRRLRNRGR